MLSPCRQDLATILESFAHTLKNGEWKRGYAFKTLSIMYFHVKTQTSSTHKKLLPILTRKGNSWKSNHAPSHDFPNHKGEMYINLGLWASISFTLYKVKCKRNKFQNWLKTGTNWYCPKTHHTNYDPRIYQSLNINFAPSPENKLDQNSITQIWGNQKFSQKKTFPCQVINMA